MMDGTVLIVQSPNATLAAFMASVLPLSVANVMKDTWDLRVLKPQYVHRVATIEDIAKAKPKHANVLLGGQLPIVRILSVLQIALEMVNASVLVFVHAMKVGLDIRAILLIAEDHVFMVFVK